MTAKTAKVVNYTDEQATQMRNEYTANPNADTVKALALAFGKNTRSVIAKLSGMDIYVKPEYLNKNGEKSQKKDDLADVIGKVLNMSEAEVTSLAKANKTALDKIFAALANSRPIED